MNKTEYKKLFWIIVLFLAGYFLPLGQARFTQAIHEALALAKWYAREHVLLCLIPAFFMAGFISVFISQGAIIKYLGGEAKKWLAYGMASIAGSVLAVCSCTILPLLAIGVLIAGSLLGSPEGSDGIIPGEWVAALVGGNSVMSNFFASIVGAFMYFATLTEIPILQGLIANGMGKGPALALLLAGPALSLPNMLVIRSVIGTQKTVVFVALVVPNAVF